jgi:hypothetical protein
MSEIKGELIVEKLGGDHYILDENRVLIAVVGLPKHAIALRDRYNEHPKLVAQRLPPHLPTERPNSDEDVYFLTTWDDGDYVIRDGYYNAKTDVEETIQVPWDKVLLWLRYSDLKTLLTDSLTPQEGATHDAN